MRPIRERAQHAVADVDEDDLHRAGWKVVIPERQLVCKVG